MEPISRTTQRLCWFWMSTALGGMSGSGVSIRFSPFYSSFVARRGQKRIGVTPRSLSISNTVGVVDFLDRLMVIMVVGRSSRESSVLITVDRWAWMNSKWRLSTGDEFLNGININQHPPTFMVSSSTVHNQHGSSDDLTEPSLYTIELVEERIIESHALHIDKS